jgi:broad specificity phosphatase PhoE
MNIYIVRHGQDDYIRGGWSDSPLTDIGIQQSLDLTNEVYNNAEKYNISPSQAQR